MKANRVTASDQALLDPDATVWTKAEGASFPMVPTPLAMVEDVSPFLARSQGQGAVDQLEVAAIHNGQMVAVRLRWKSDQHDKLMDLNTFMDGVAAIFPVKRGTFAVTMGSAGKPVNAWYWKAGAKDPYEVVAEGFRSVQRLKDPTSDLTAAARYGNGGWDVIFRRSFAAGGDLVQLSPGRSSKIAFAAWNGGNDERSGRKSFSGEFIDFEIAK